MFNHLPVGDDKIDFLAIEREARRLRAEAVANAAGGLVRLVSRSFGKLMHIGPYGNPARG